MRTLCLGGSFNPIHHGHLICARAVAESAGYDRILLIPSGQPPHKLGQSALAPATHRLRMCELAGQTQTRTASACGFAVSNIETLTDIPNYTIQTARQLKSSGFTEVNWLIGADMLNFLPRWHAPDDLLREINFIVMHRGGVPIDWPSLPEKFHHLKDHVVQAPLIEISSTDIRERVRENRSIDFLTPPAVVDYIASHGLYR